MLISPCIESPILFTFCHRLKWVYTGGNSRNGVFFGNKKWVASSRLKRFRRPRVKNGKRALPSRLLSMPRRGAPRSCLVPRHLNTAFPGRGGALLEANRRHLSATLRNPKKPASRPPSGRPARTTYPEGAPKVLHGGQRRAIPPTRGPCRRPWPRDTCQNGFCRILRIGSGRAGRPAGSPPPLLRHSAAWG